MLRCYLVSLGLDGLHRKRAIKSHESVHRCLNQRILRVCTDLQVCKGMGVSTWPDLWYFKVIATLIPYPQITLVSTSCSKHMINQIYVRVNEYLSSYRKYILSSTCWGSANQERNCCWETGSSTHCSSWWRHRMKTFSVLLAICAGNSPVTGGFPAQRPVAQSFDVFLDLHLNKQLSKRSWGCYLRCHCAHYDVTVMCYVIDSCNGYTIHWLLSARLQ